MTVLLEVGGYLIELREPSDYPVLTWPVKPFDAFVAPVGRPPDLHVDIAVVPRLPDLQVGALAFDAGPGQWRLFAHQNGYVIESASPLFLAPRARAIVSGDYRSIRLWVVPDRHEEQHGWSPVHILNPIVEICLLSRLALDRGVLLHAAGLSFQEEGFIFTGSSGAGKSTITEFFARRGAVVMSDERLIVRHTGLGWLLFGTPWMGSGSYARNACTPVSRLYCISHGHHAHAITSWSPSALVRELLRQCVLPVWSREAMEATLAAVAHVVEEVHCRGLASLKLPDVVDFLMGDRPMLGVSS